jgi:hypothetical protein
VDASQAELVTVISHTEDGRIFQYVKNLVPVTEGERLKAAARLRNEEREADKLLKNTRSLIEKAREPQAAPRQHPTVRHVPQRSVIPLPVRRPTIEEQQAANAKELAALQKQSAELQAEIIKLTAARAKEAASIAGQQFGRDVVRKLTEIGRASGPNATVRLGPDKLRAAMHGALKELYDADYDSPSARQPEFAPAFAAAFHHGIAEAVAEFNQQTRATT